MPGSKSAIRLGDAGHEGSDGAIFCVEGGAMTHPLEYFLDEIGLCPGAGIPAARAHLTLYPNGMWHCNECGRPVLLRAGIVSLHGERAIAKEEGREP
jgi:hypothetical protein